MFNRALGIVVLGLAATAFCNAQERRTDSSADARAESEDIAEANRAVLLKLAVASSPKGQILCSEDPRACIGPDRAQLGLSLIAARNTKKSEIALTTLVRFRLDGELSEAYNCRLLDKGRAILGDLLALSPGVLRAECHSEYEKVALPLDSDLGGVREDYVCRSIAEMKRDIQLTVTAIRSEHHCQ